MNAELTAPVIPAAWNLATDPIEVDMGCHRGTFLIGMAQAFPEVRFLGVERQRGRVERCLRKIERLELPNAHAIQGEGLGSLEEARIRVDRIHVSFPDPWPKRRHHVRRMVNASFIARARVLLRAGGELRLMTDDEAYFRAMEAAALTVPGYISVEWEDGRAYPPTEFQLKFAAVAKPVYRLALRRCDSSNSA